MEWRETVDNDDRRSFSGRFQDLKCGIKSCQLIGKTLISL